MSSNLTSIVIVTHNQLEYTRLCVASIARHTPEPYEFVFVDNGSSDGTVEFLKEVNGKRSPARRDADGSVSGEQHQSAPVQVTVAVNAHNRGFPVAANQAIRAATGEQILLLNNDTIVTSGWLSRMLRVLQSDPQIGMVGPCSNFVSGPQQVDVSYAGRGPVSIDQFDHAKLDEFAQLWSEAHDGQLQETDRLVGFCLLIRREVVDKIGLFDERFEVGNFEDDDYCRRAREAGYRLVIARDAFVHHFGGATFRASGIDFGALIGRNERLFREKWEARVQGSGFRVQEKDRSKEVSNQLPSSGDDLTEPRTLTPEPSLSLCMIARDNERTIRAALESIRPWVDEMVFIDTGSTDRTPEIAADLGARVFHFPWCDDFSAARNESIRHARGQWVFWMDTDDTIDSANGSKLQKLVRRVARDPPRGVLGFLMKVRCPGSDLNGQHGAVEVDHVKLFRNRPELRFEGRIHEQILMAIRRAGGTVAWTDIVIDHSGCDQSPEGRARKLERDLRILELEYKERPDHPFTLFNLGMTHEHAGNFERAIGFLWQSIGRSDDDDSHLRKAYAILVLSYRQLGRLGTAFDTCVKGLKHYPDDVELRYQQAVLLYALGRPLEAARAYEELRALQTSRHLSSVDRGLQGYRSGHNLAGLYMELGEYSKAEQLWRQVTEQSPWFMHAWHGLVDVLLLQGKTDEALQCAEMLKSHPDMLRGASRLRRRVLVNRGEVQTALDELNRDLVALSRANGGHEPPGPSGPWVDQEAHAPRSPLHLELLEERCRLLFEHCQPAEAERAFRALLEYDPQNPAAHHNLGTIHYKRGRFDEAAAEYRRSIQLRPQSACTHLHLGYALRDAGKINEAIAAWKQALEIEPGEPLAIAALADVIPQWEKG